MTELTNYDITGSMNRVLQSFESLFDQTCSQYLLEKMIKQINTASPSEKRFAIRALENTLKMNHVEETVALDQSGHVENADRLIQSLPSQDALERQLYRRLSEMYVYFPGTKVFIERLVNQLGDPDLMTGSVRLRILKQFLQYIRKSVYSVKKLRALIEKQFTEEEAITFSKLKTEPDKRHFYALSAKEEVFKALDNPMEYSLKKDDVRLLSICDNFARGRILNQGGTRRSIFEFAIVFGMNSHVATDPSYSPDLDIEKNLFFDFCINGYVDTLRERGEQAGADTANDELTTEGINYKNYAEIIYLYALNHPSMPREDRIKYALDLIKSCSARYKKTESGAEEEQGTVFFRGSTYSNLFNETGYSMERDELEAYICRHYPLSQLNTSVSPLLQAAEQGSARKEYLLLCETLEDELRLYDRNLDELDYTLGIFKGNGTEYDPLEYPFPDDLRMILLDLNQELLRHVKRRKEIFDGFRLIKTRAGEIKKESVVVRRLDFLILYYEYFIAVHEDDNETAVLMLEDIYRSFADHLNPVFERSRYAGISAKSMPDVLLILFAYNMVTLLS